METGYNKEVMKHFLKPKNFGEIKNPDGVGTMGNMKCLLPEEKIYLNGDFKEIKNAQKGELVISHDSSLNEIIEKFSRDYNGKIIYLKNCMGSIKLTTEHLIYAIKLPKRAKYLRIKNKQKLFPAWYHAEDLEKGDIILYPIYNEIEDKKNIELKVEKLRWDFKSFDLPKKIPLNKDFLRLCGYFLSEGHISESKCRNYITIAFNINQEEYANDVKNIVKKLFGIDVIFRKDGNCLVVMIYSANLARFFKKLFNKGALNKKIPDFFMKLPIEKQKYLIEGLWKGDGYINLNRIGPRAGYVTISYQLAQQIKILLLRQRIVPSIYVEKEKVIKGVNHKTAYRIHVGQRDSLDKLSYILGIRYSPKSYPAIASWFNKDFLFTPISKVELKEYAGHVYNLEVKNAHSFISESFCLHNCGDIMEISFKLDKEKEKIKNIKFKTWGCVAAIASSDALCELAKGKTLSEAKKITNKDIVDKLKGLPSVKLHCSVLGAGALHKAIENFEKNEEKKDN